MADFGRGRGRASISSLSLLLGLLLLAPRAQAAEPAELERLISQGVEMRQKGRDQVALPFFQKAYDLEPSPRTAAQLGLVELALGYALAAERHLGEALSSPHHLWVAKNRKKLETALTDARKAIATIEVSGTPAGAEVLVNGNAVGTLPLPAPVSVAEGTAQVVVRAPGFVEKALKMPIHGGGHERVTVDLVSSTAAAGEATGALTPPPKPAVSAPLGVHAASSSDRAAWIRPAAWAATAAAAVAVGFGTWSLVRAKGKQDDFNTQTRPGSSELACDVDFVNFGPEPCGSYYRDAHSARQLGWISLSVGAVFAAGAAAGFFWFDERDSQMGLAPVGDGLAASWSTRF